MFDSETRDILCTAGWFPDRQIVISGWIKALSAEGFQPNALGARILSTLGGLEIKPLNFDRIYFDPTIASGEFDRVEEWQKDAGSTLFPLGEVLSHYILFIDELGKTYVGFDEGLFQIGETFDEGFHRLYFENGGTPRPCMRKRQD